MRTALQGLMIGVLAGALVVVDAANARAQTLTAADLFNDQVLHEVRLFVNSRDLVQFRARYLENVYVPADLTWNGLRVRNVGIRSRGFGSRNPTKMGLRVDFNRYTRNQKFLGLSSLVLDNVWQDASMMREALAMQVFRRLGEPAPRESFAKLYINNVYQGVYALVEPVDALFVQRAINESAGYLFEYRYVQPFYMGYLGDDLNAYKPMFQPETHVLEPDSLLYGPIRDLFREINEPDDAVWRERVEARIDLAQFIRHAAIQGFLEENDGLMGFLGINNFYLYRFAGTNRHRLFAWDEDFAFTFINESVLRRGDQPMVLFDRALAQPDLRMMFLDLCERAAHEITENGWLSTEIERIVALISPAVFEDTRKQFSNQEYLDALNFLREFASTRTTYVLDEIARLRQ